MKSPEVVISSVVVASEAVTSFVVDGVELAQLLIVGRLLGSEVEGRVVSETSGRVVSETSGGVDVSFSISPLLVIML